MRQVENSVGYSFIAVCKSLPQRSIWMCRLVSKLLSEEDALIGRINRAIADQIAEHELLSLAAFRRRQVTLN